MCYLFPHEILNLKTYYASLFGWQNVAEYCLAMGGDESFYHTK